MRRTINIVAFAMIIAGIPLALLSATREVGLGLLLVGVIALISVSTSAAAGASE